MTLTNDSPRAKKILCVDDDLDTCAFLAVMFRQYDFEAAATIADARSFLGNGGFDLYILDNWLPDGSGVELCRSIRECWPDVPIVFTSAVATKQDIDVAIAAGADRYVTKPYEPETLSQIVKELLA